MSKTKNSSGQAAKPLHPYTHEQLCRVKRVRKGVVKAGVVLAYDGCWQNKAVVKSVTFSHAEKSYGGDLLMIYCVVISPLGKFFADGRQQPTKSKLEHEVLVTVYANNSCHSYYGLGRWKIVEPLVESAVKGPPLSFDTKAAAPGQHPYEYADFQPVGLEAAPLTPEQQAQVEFASHLVPECAMHQLAPSGKGKTKSAPVQERAPEAVLADFLIK